MIVTKKLLRSTKPGAIFAEGIVENNGILIMGDRKYERAELHWVAEKLQSTYTWRVLVMLKVLSEGKSDIVRKFGYVIFGKKYVSRCLEFSNNAWNHYQPKQ